LNNPNVAIAEPFGMNAHTTRRLHVQIGVMRTSYFRSKIELCTLTLTLQEKALYRDETTATTTSACTRQVHWRVSHAALLC